MQIIASILSVRFSQLLQNPKQRTDTIEQAKKTYKVVEKYAMQ